MGVSSNKGFLTLVKDWSFNDDIMKFNKRNGKNIDNLIIFTFATEWRKLY